MASLGVINLSTGNQIDPISRDGFQVNRNNDTYICKEVPYEFYISRRDFTFPHPPEDEKSFNPWQPYRVGRVDFVFPEFECKEPVGLITDIYSGFTLEEFTLETPLRLDTEISQGWEISPIAIPTFTLEDIGYGNYIEDIRQYTYIDVGISTGWTFEIAEQYLIYTGHSLQVKLDVPLPISNAYYGNSLADVPLKVTSNLSPNNQPLEISQGFTAEVNLGGTFAFGDLGYGYELTIKELRVPEKYWVYTGNTLEVDLIAYKNLIGNNNNLDLGEGNNLRVVIGEPKELLVDSYTGNSVTWSNNLPDSEFYTGNSLDVFLRYSEKGRELKVKDVEQGNALRLPYITEKQSHYLYPYDLHSNTNFVSVSLNGTYETFFDRIIPCCYEGGIIGGNDHYWEISKKFNVNEEVGFNISHQLQPTELATRANLATRIGFGFAVEEAELFKPINEVYVYTGNTLEFKFRYDPVINICGAHTIISGDNANIEMLDTQDYNCAWHQAYYGNTVTVESIGVHPRFGGDFWFGYQLEPSLSLYTWEVDMFWGQMVHIDLKTTPRFYPNFYHGSTVESKFYEPNIDLYYGNNIESLQIRANYLVEFIDKGCLENEYIYTDELNIRRDELTIPVAVEFLPFKHDIKARCF